MNYPFVSVVMPCGNEVGFIRKSLSSLLATAYPKENLEIIIVVDDYSSDGTKKILKEVASQNKIVKILNNPHRVVPFAMNIGIKATKGEIIIRADAHTEYPPDYINKCVEYLQTTGAWCVGGPFYTTSAKSTLVAQVIIEFLSSSFGVGGAAFRTKKEPLYVDTVPYGAFRREVFEKIGLYDERLVRHQDYELCCRMRRAGGKIFMTPEIKNIYYARDTLAKLLHKARYYGLWDALSHKLCPYTFTWRHFVSAPFFLGVLGCFISIISGIAAKQSFFVFLGIAPIGLYFLLALPCYTRICLRKKWNILKFLLLNAVSFLYHFNFGYGYVKGWIMILTGKWKKIVPGLQEKVK